MGGGIPSAANFMPALTGLNNRVSNYGVASAGAEYVMPTQPSLAAFNGGKPVLDQVRGGLGGGQGAGRLDCLKPGKQPQQSI